MKARFLLVACIAILIILLAPAGASLAQGPNDGPGPLLVSPTQGGPLNWQGVPTTGPFTGQQIKQRPAPPKDMSGLQKQFDAKIAALDKAAKAAGLKIISPSQEQLQAVKQLEQGLTKQQKSGLAQSFQNSQAAFKRILAPIQQGVLTGGKTKGQLDIDSTNRQVAAWQAGLDSAARGILNAEQMKLYTALEPKLPQNPRNADLSGLSKSTESPQPKIVASSCSNAYSAYYYAYYGYVYTYYGYVYAYYAYITNPSPDTYDYDAYFWSSWANYYAYYGYVEDYYGWYYAPDSYDSYYGYLYMSYAEMYGYYAYIYAYYAYYYLVDYYGYFYDSYYWNYYGYVYSYIGYLYSNYGYSDSQVYFNGDDDGDSLLNGWEIYGYNYNGSLAVDLPCLGASYHHKDIFVEMDYMVGPNGSLAPSSNEMSAMEAMFANAPVPNLDGTTGINLHLNLASQVPYYSNLNMWTDFDTIKASYFPASHAAIYHYMIWANQYNNGCSSGLSRGIPASDYVVTLGPTCWGNNVPSSYRIGTNNHELGHNLGLTHGGNDSVNYKPNYLSIMNYMWQLTGLWYNGGWVMDYQRMDLPTLNEASLYEPSGLGPSAFGYYTQHNCGGTFVWSGSTANNPIDWNCDGTIENSNVSYDINADGFIGTLGTQNNWANINFTGASIIGVPLTPLQYAARIAATTQVLQEASREELLRFAEYNQRTKGPVK